mmetsp:Transcript_74495/g.177714  ORF Transcript_74495/g.177714 Transcript_74495/m.177714 type:complete len:285 (-) Transcript_74495:627-1481(-)
MPRSSCIWFACKRVRTPTPVAKSRWLKQLIASAAHNGAEPPLPEPSSRPKSALRSARVSDTRELSTFPTSCACRVRPASNIRTSHKASKSWRRSRTWSSNRHESLSTASFRGAQASSGSLERLGPAGASPSSASCQLWITSSVCSSSQLGSSARSPQKMGDALASGMPVWVPATPGMAWAAWPSSSCHSRARTTQQARSQRCRSRGAGARSTSCRAAASTSGSTSQAREQESQKSSKLSPNSSARLASSFTSSLEGGRPSMGCIRSSKASCGSSWISAPASGVG